MRRWTCPVTVLALFLLLIPGLPYVDGTDIGGATAPSLLLFRVAPSTPLEFTTVQNVSNHTVDLSGWTIGDGEGWVRINASIPLRPGDRLSLSPDPASFITYYPDESALGYREGRVTFHGSLALADKGDQVDLADPEGVVRDSFSYGSVTPSAGWTGSPFIPLPKGDMAVRDLTLPDTDTVV